MKMKRFEWIALIKSITIKIDELLIDSNSRLPWTVQLINENLTCAEA